MAKKVIRKTLLDEVIAAERAYWDDGGEDYEYVSNLHHKIANETGLWAICVSSLFTAITSSHGLKPDATNEDIYAVLRLLGWEVAE